jgi:hypothetical protein
MPVVPSKYRGTTGYYQVFQELITTARVLQASGRPMTEGEIAAEALRRGLLVTKGKTPERSMAAALYLAQRDDPDCPVKRVFEPGTNRARRGSVKWRVKARQ